MRTRAKSYHLNAKGGDHHCHPPFMYLNSFNMLPEESLSKSMPNLFPNKCINDFPVDFILLLP